MGQYRFRALLSPEQKISERGFSCVRCQTKFCDDRQPVALMHELLVDVPGNNPDSRQSKPGGCIASLSRPATDGENIHNAKNNINLLPRAHFSQTFPLETSRRWDRIMCFICHLTTSLFHLCCQIIRFVCYLAVFSGEIESRLSKRLSSGRLHIPVLNKKTRALCDQRIKAFCTHGSSRRIGLFVHSQPADTVGPFGTRLKAVTDCTQPYPVGPRKSHGQRQFQPQIRTSRLLCQWYSVVLERVD